MRLSKFHKSAALIALVMIFLPSAAFSETLDLEKAVSLALENNGTLNADKLDASGAKWGQAGSVSAYLPKAYLENAYTRIDPDTYDKIKKSDAAQKALLQKLGANTTNQKPSGYEDSYASSFKVVQPIFNGGAEIAGIYAATIDKHRLEYHAENTKDDTVNKVKSAWYAAQKASALEQTNTEALQLASETLKLTQTRFEIGQVSRSEVLRWESQEAQAQGALIESRQTFTLARLSLNALLGVDLDRQWEFPELDLNAPIETQQANALNATLDMPAFTTFASHPGILEMDQTVGLAEGQRYISIGQVLPKANFVWNYSWETNDTMALDGQKGWTAMITLEIPLFQSLGGAFGIMKSQRQLQATRLRRDEFRRAFLQRAYAAQLNMRSAVQRVASARSALAFADENQKIVKTRLGLGAATNLDLLDAQVTYITSKTTLVSALADYKIASSEYEYVTAK